MKTDKFRRSQNVEDYRDPNRSIDPLDEYYESIAEQVRLAASKLAGDLGSNDVLKKKD